MRGFLATGLRPFIATLVRRLAFTSDALLYCDERNIASQKVMKNIGMEFAGSNGIRTYEKDVEDWEEVKYCFV